METDLLNWVRKFLSNMSTIFPAIRPGESKRSGILSDASKKQHMRNAVQPNLDLRQVVTLEDTLRHVDSTKE